jgi:hypothetical protein
VTDLYAGREYFIVTDAFGSLEGSYSHIEDLAVSTKKMRLVQKRHRWWQSPLSSFTFYAIRHKILQ